MLRLIAVFFTLMAVSVATPVFGAEPVRAEDFDEGDSSGQSFSDRLSSALERTEKSIKLAREQIVQSQTAPFLPQLYMQLAELLSQKSNTLYYMKMEKDKASSMPDVSDKAFSPVIQAQQEAVSIYRLLLRDFPEFPRRMQVMLRMATALKSIDETGEFIKTSSEILRLYPNSEDALRVRLLLGQHYFDKRQDDMALQLFLPVSRSGLVYERNLAKYRIGLIYIAKDKFKDALAFFEQVALDSDLKEQKNPYELSLKKSKKATRADLKRDALIDSIRAYTRVHEKDPDPVPYYARLAPTEAHFQEVIEKLSLRYINLKKYSIAVKLLRTLSERTADPKRIIGVYQEVLLMIPLHDRISIPSKEIQFVLEKYNAWSSFYEIPNATKTLAYNFFEKQIRDFGTTSHGYAKGEKDAARRTSYLTRARDFYLVYLGYFWNSPNAVKIGTNLADVYYALGDYFRSGDYYLRVFSGEFGQPRDKKLLIENAILCFEKKSNYGFFENLRLRGLLIDAISRYMSFDKKKQSDSKLAFAKLKAEYDQGFFPEVLESSFDYMRRFRRFPQAVEAGELILDHLNTRNDFAGLENWTNRMLGLKVPNPAFNKKLASIRQTARSRSLGEKVKSLEGYDAFAQGKGYLAAALSIGDQRLSSEALKQALARSKAERDILTFLEAASTMARHENDPKKKAVILKSIARENLRVTRFRSAIQNYAEIAQNPAFSTEDRRQAFEEGINTALMMRDWKTVQSSTAGIRGLEMSRELKTRVREQMGDVLSSPVKTPPEVAETLFRLGVSDESMLALFKSQYRLPAPLQARIHNEASSRCSSQSRQLFCRWINLQRAEGQIAAFTRRLKAAPRTLAGIESVAQEFAVVSNALQSLEGSGDPLLETTLSMTSYGTYMDFADYLKKCASANPELRAILSQKAEESVASAKLYQNRCLGIGARDVALRPKLEFCRRGETKTVREALQTKLLSPADGSTGDPSDTEIDDYRRILFAEKADGQRMIALALRYLKTGSFHHAAATASYGMSLYRPEEAEFKTILGCSLVELGMFGEAAYHLRTQSAVPGAPRLREECSKRLYSAWGDL